VLLLVLLLLLLVLLLLLLLLLLVLLLVLLPLLLLLLPPPLLLLLRLLLLLLLVPPPLLLHTCNSVPLGRRGGGSCHAQGREGGREGGVVRGWCSEKVVWQESVEGKGCSRGVRGLFEVVRGILHGRSRVVRGFFDYLARICALLEPGPT
jgi:hypothetical protein